MLADTVVTADDLVVQVPLEPSADGPGRRLVSVLVPARLLTAVPQPVRRGRARVGRSR